MIKQDVDVLFINPNALDKIYQKLSTTFAAIEPPIWGALLANGIRAKNYSAAMVDAEGLHMTPEDVAKKVSDYNPRLIVIVVYGQQPSASTQNMCGASLACTAIKERHPESKILFVGGHVSALPKQTLLEQKTDFVCRGEGLYTICGLLEIDLNDPSQYTKVPGLWYLQDGEVKSNPDAAVIPQEKLSQELPGMAFDLLAMKNYRAHNWHCFDRIDERQPYASVYTSLGCPFRCTFCCINAPFGKSSFRYWNPEFMIRQFDILAQNYNIKNIKIADEMFVMNEKHFMKLCELLKERNYGFNIWAYARVDTIKPKYLKTLKEAGVNWLALGIESFSKYVRDGVTKGKYTEDDIFKTVQMIKDAGIYVLGNYIFGLPDDTLERMMENLDMAIELNCEMINFYSGMAYPGSQLYRIAIENKWKLPETWVGFSQHAYETLPLPTKYVSSEEVLAFRDAAWQIYNTHPSYLRFLEVKFGESTVKHVRQMTTLKLNRKYAAPDINIDLTKYPHYRPYHSSLS